MADAEPELKPTPARIKAMKRIAEGKNIFPGGAGEHQLWHRLYLADLISSGMGRSRAYCLTSRGREWLKRHG